MSVSKKDTEYVANLARLGLTDEEKNLFTEQLNHILSYVDVINSVDTQNISPTASSRLSANAAKATPMREDKSAAFADTSAIMANAPQSEENMFRVPKILETE